MAAVSQTTFSNAFSWMKIKISLKFVPKGPINNNPALVQIMAWRRSGDKPLSEPMMVSLLTHICVTRPQWVKYTHGLGWDWSSMGPVRYNHDDVIEWKHFPRCWPFVRGIHRSPVNSPYKGQWLRALMVSMICAWIKGSVNNREAGDLKRHRTHYDVTLMQDTHVKIP